MCSQMRDTYLRYNYFVREHVSLPKDNESPDPENGKQRTEKGERRTEFKVPESGERLRLRPEEDVGATRVSIQHKAHQSG